MVLHCLFIYVLFQESGLEQQKEAASELIRKAKVAQEAIIEGERKAEAAR